MKIFFRRIHLYLGIGTGLIIMITCLTGAILVYEKELMQLFHPDRYFVKAETTRLSTDSLINKLKLQEPKAGINSIKLYNNPGRTAEISITLGGEQKSKKAAATREVKGQKKPAEGTRLVAFLNPYNGQVMEIYNHRKSFFYWVMDVHRWMLGGDIGKMVVGVATLLFLVIIITGIVLWWPRNKQILKQRLKIKSGAGFKRLNHDFHVVLGFYSSIFLFVLAFTGLAWSFEWFNKGIYTVTGSSMERAKPLKNANNDSLQRVGTEAALSVVIGLVKDAHYYNVALPKDPKDAYAVSLLSLEAAHESAGDTYFIDSYKGSLIGQQLFTDRNKGQRVRATFKPIHVASIYGNTSKIIGVVVCLLGTFFPASGIIMWWNRTRKKNKAARNATSIH